MTDRIAAPAPALIEERQAPPDHAPSLRQATIRGRSRPVPVQIGLLMIWQARRSLPMLPLIVTVQMLLAVATVVGYGLIAGDPGRQAGLYLATGAPTISLVSLGLIMAPQWLAQSRTEGSLDWLRTLPVARASFFLADLLLWSVLALPGLVTGILVGAARFDIELSPAWWLVPAALLVSITAACVGYSIAVLCAPALAQVLSQVLVFVIMLFSPVSFPASRLPQWAQDVHQWLPFEPMAQVIRAGLCSDWFSVPGRSWILLAAWSSAAAVGTVRALGRRG